MKKKDQISLVGKFYYNRFGEEDYMHTGGSAKVPPSVSRAH